MNIQGIKVRIYPNKEQESYISRLLGSARFVFNTMLELKQQTFAKTGKYATFSECGKRLTELRHLDEFAWFKEIHTHPMRQSLNDLEKAYYNFFNGNGKVGAPQFKSKHDKQSCRFPNTAISGIFGNRITLIKQLKNIHFKCSRFDEIYLNKNQDIIRSATLEKTKSGRYFLSILIEKPTKRILPKTDKIIGIDIGIKDFIVTSDGKRFANLKTIRSNEKKLKKLQRNHSKKQKGSENKEKARKKLAKFHRKLYNVKENYLHQVSNQLLNENQVIAFETLNLRGMMKNHSMAKSIQELSAFHFKEMTKYKAKWYERKIIDVAKFYPSSKLCECCGFKNDLLTLADRTWICPKCGIEHDRDLNAARNIRNEGIRLLAERNLQPPVLKATKRKIGGKKLQKLCPPIADNLPACSGDVKLVENSSLELSVKQEKNVISELTIIVV